MGPDFLSLTLVPGSYPALFYFQLNRSIPDPFIVHMDLPIWLSPTKLDFNSFHYNFFLKKRNS